MVEERDAKQRAHFSFSGSRYNNNREARARAMNCSIIDATEWLLAK